ncbi:divalent-cation tolerance protein CutA [Thiohalomonas denitrificans]|uniref:Divalent cation tolerance protein n=1 Tax=Thiohalomonas denitrificans TaxID=415747 RepID=A0A1G5PRD5_9GAMM|nr:divalent-cation tolerance protein CutA [Thiohalomonas denitrificans]SCZ52002.1 divalent cation tolerance protein [Thiohalomonas denitrificans]
MSEYRLVITTCPDQNSADALAAYLVDHRLAACVNTISGMRSYYQWKGEVCNDAEFILLIKSRADLYPRLEETIVERHPYELPEVIALPIESGLDDYLRWIDEQTGK